jgi:anti-sigma regulatory factor (Ser/Thr protein kinase)
MSHTSCPNCGAGISTTIATEPPTTCPDCCARLHIDNGLSTAPPARPRRSPDLDLTIHADSTAPQIARQGFTSYAGQLDEGVSSTATLLISELVTNAVIHAPVMPPSAVALHCSLVGATLQVEVAGGGNAFVPRARVEDHGTRSGWGLHLVDTMADAWGVDPGRPVRVWFELAV